MPTKNSFPSTRQYFAIPENCSRWDWMYTLLPTATRAFIRMHAPCAEWFSIRAVTDCTAPDKSSHEASTRIITAVRASCAAPLIPPSIGKIKQQFNHHPPLDALRRAPDVPAPATSHFGTCSAGFHASPLDSPWGSEASYAVAGK